MDISVIPDFSEAKDFDDIVAQFAAAAKSIMFNHDLVYGDRTRQITALELYLYTGGSDVWRDPFTHKSDEQLNSGTWYVHGDIHRRAPNYSGIDISAGSRAKNIHAGLLIRELDHSDGSAKALQTIVRGEYVFRRKGNEWTSDEKHALQQVHQNSIFDAPLRLIRRSDALTDQKLWCGPRWGLNPRPANDESKKFSEAPLRMASWITNKHKEKMRVSEHSL